MAGDHTRDRRVPRRPVLRRGVDRTPHFAVRTDGPRRLMNPAPTAQSGAHAFLIYFRYDDTSEDFEGSSEPLIAVMRSSAELQELDVETSFQGHSGTLDWDTQYLQGPDAPYSTWPNVEEVHLVSEGGIGNEIGDTGIDPVVYAVFIGLADAEAFARRHHRPSVVVRTVPVGELLPTT